MYTNQSASTWSKFQRCICLVLAMLTMVACFAFPGMIVHAHAAGKIVSIPKPEQYFSNLTAVNACSTGVNYYFQSNSYAELPETAIDAYIEDLEDCGLAVHKKPYIAYQNAIVGRRYELHWNDERALDIHWSKNDCKIRVQLFDCVTVSSNTIPQPATGDSKPSIVKLVKETFGSSPEVDNDGEQYGTRYEYHLSAYPAQKMAAFAKRLKSAGLEEVEKYSHSDGGKCIEYRWDDEGCIKIWYYPKKVKENSEFIVGINWDVLEKSGAFDEKDIPGEPEPTNPNPGDRERCFWCGGDGKCRDCGGSGYVMKWVSGTVREYVRQNCTSCYSPGKCRDCGGSGWK